MWENFLKFIDNKVDIKIVDSNYHFPTFDYLTKRQLSTIIIVSSKKPF